MFGLNVSLLPPRFLKISVFRKKKGGSVIGIRNVLNLCVELTFICKNYSDLQLILLFQK